MKFITQIKIWRLPFILKLTAIAFILDGVYKLRKIFEPCASAKCNIEVTSVFFAVLSIVIAIGIIIGSDVLRGCASVFIFLGIIAALFFFGLVLFKVVDLPGGHIITYDMSKRPWIILGLSAFLVLQIKAFVALLKPIESPSDSNHAIQEITNP